MKKFLTLPIAALIGLASLPLTAHADWRSGEFPTMQTCLEGIKAFNKSELRIVTDKSSQVSGRFVRTGEPFMCIRKETGSKGIYYEGSFDDGE